MNGLDLFSGIGGLTKALEKYVKPVAYCENDRYAQGVLLSRQFSGDLPIAPIWDDVSTLRGNMLPPIDCIYGGFPCQDISVAGKQVGLGGERSGLFFEIVRLARETGAEWLFLENVPNIRTKGLGRVLKELESLGYDCRWGLLSAADVGANHKRERWFLLAHSKSIRLEINADPGRKRTGISEDGWYSIEPTGPGTEAANPNHKGFGISLSSGASQDSGPRTSEGSCDVADAQGEQGRRICVAGIHKDIGAAGDGRGQTAWWAVEPRVGRVANGIPNRVDRLRALGNAVVPAQAREAFERLMGLK